MKTYKRTISRNGRTEQGYAYTMPESLEEAIALVQMERDLRKRSAGYKVADHWFHSDLDSKIEQIGLLLLAQNIPATLMWKTMSRVRVPMTPALAQTVFLTGVAATAAIFAAADNHIAQIEANGWVGHSYFTGWPQAYWEVQS